MLHALVLVVPDPDVLPEAQDRARRILRDLGAVTKEEAPLGSHAWQTRLDVDDPARLKPGLEAALAGAPVDFGLIADDAFRKKRLLVADMDSTIIGVECLDELADFAGVKAQVSAITERAMRGEIDFEGALRERVGMLKGLSSAVLQHCYDQRVRLNPGARTLVATMAAHGARCVLVSGGFDFFTSRVAEAAGFHQNHANRLLEADGALAGTVAEPILGREAKLAALRDEAGHMGLSLRASIAVGDGANDLAMMEASGFGVAYRAKPKVAAQADARVDHTDLTTLLYFQGYRREEFVG